MRHHKISMRRLTLDENLTVTELRSGSLSELHTTEVLGIPRGNDPLLNGLRNRLRHVEDVLLVFVGCEKVVCMMSCSRRVEM